MPLGTLGELQGSHLHDAVLLGGIGDMDAFVNGQTRYLAEVVVGMSADGANPVRAEGYSFGVTAVNLIKLLFAVPSSLLYCHTDITDYTDKFSTDNFSSLRLEILQN